MSRPLFGFTPLAPRFLLTRPKSILLRLVLFVAFATAALALSGCKIGPLVIAPTATPSDPLAQLQRFVDNPSKASYRTVYSYKAQSLDLRATYFHRENQQRLDLVGNDANGQPRETRNFYNKNDQVFISCSKEVNADWQCDKTTGDDAESAASNTFSSFDWSQGTLQQLIKDSRDKGAPIVRQKSRKIVGENALIFTYKSPPPDEGEAEIGLTTDGLFLFLNVQTPDVQNSGRIEATEFKRQVADDDFKPPVAVQ